MKIIENLPIEDYHYGPEYACFLSASCIKEANKSLKAFKYHMNNKNTQERKIHFDFGNAFELALLEPNTFKSKVFVFDPDRRPEPEKTFASKANKEWKNEIEEKVNSNNQYLINKTGEHSKETIQEMLISCSKNFIVKKLLANINYQHSFFWKCKDTRLLLKTRPDVCVMNKKNIIDIKTIDSASPESVSKSIKNFGYTTQAIMQINGVVSCDYVNKIDNYFWLFIEKKPPYDVVMYEFSKEDRKLAYEKYMDTLRRIAKAYKDDNFPGYSEFGDPKFGILTAKIWQ